jgi:hypothetical protein
MSQQEKIEERCEGVVPCGVAQPVSKEWGEKSNKSEEEGWQGVELDNKHPDL